MFDVADSLMHSLGAARRGLSEAALQTSRSQTPLGGSRTDSDMASVAEKAIFTEALLNAMHARLAEI